MSTIAQQLTLGGSRSSGQPVRTQNGKCTIWFIKFELKVLQKTCDRKVPNKKMIHKFFSS